MEKNVRQALDIISARIGSELTDEQREFASDFREPLISFSNPGTGKSYSIIVGLIMAQTIHKVSGKKINAMSFTKAATAELKARYDKACRQCDIVPTAKFNTFHSICYTIVREKYPTMKIKQGIDYGRDLPILQTYLSNYGVETDDMFYIRRILEAINSLNSALTFDEENVQSSFKFKMLDLSVDVFQNLRRDWFVLGLTTKTITQGDIPIYALYALASNKALQEKYKNMYKIMIVDEFQDLSLLHLKILSLISSNLVAIGDMKQQIYAFNGSSQQIVEEYKKMYPNAREVNLTKSFRCKNEIADFATHIIYQNDNSVKAFQGTGDGGSVKTMASRDMDLEEIVRHIKQEQDKEEYGKFRDTMFLFRNNFSATPIAEELYKQDVLFRVNRFAKIMQLPIFSDLTKLALIASEPDNLTYLQEIVNLFPEFREFNSTNCPLLIAISKTRSSLFDIRYEFKEQSSIRIINLLKKAKLFIDKDAMAGVIFQILLPIYEEYIIEGKWWKLDFDKEFYFDLVAPIVDNKTLKVMIAEEYDKERKITNCINVGMGVKCYTIHSAKGLEANDVYIIDAEDGLFPSQKAMTKYVNAGCECEAAKDLRNERNLLYVGITRAKDNTFIAYHSKLTSLIASPKENEYTYLDDIYKHAHRDFDDVGAFIKLFKLEQQLEASPQAIAEQGNVEVLPNKETTVTEKFSVEDIGVDIDDL